MSQEVLLYTQELQAAKQEIESLGGRIAHRFTDAVLVASLPDLINPLTLAKSSSTVPPGLDEVSKIAADAWTSVGSTPGLAALEPKRGLSWDAPGHKPPGKITRSLSKGMLRSTDTPTSLYMTGSIAVGVVIVSGPNAIVSFDPKTPITALSRKPDHIDLFAVGADIPSDGTTGRTKVYTTWWGGSWHEWGTVGTQTFPIKTPIAAIARREDHIDLFAVGPDRRVYTTWWDGSWHEWGTVGTQTFPAPFTRPQK